MVSLTQSPAHTRLSTALAGVTLLALVVEVVTVVPLASAVIPVPVSSST